MYSANQANKKQKPRPQTLRRLVSPIKESSKKHFGSIQEGRSSASPSSCKSSSLSFPGLDEIAAAVATTDHDHSKAAERSRTTKTSSARMKMTKASSKSQKGHSPTKTVSTNFASQRSASKPPHHQSKSLDEAAAAAVAVPSAVANPSFVTRGDLSEFDESRDSPNKTNSKIAPQQEDNDVDKTVIKRKRRRKATSKPKPLAAPLPPSPKVDHDEINNKVSQLRELLRNQKPVSMQVTSEAPHLAWLEGLVDATELESATLQKPIDYAWSVYSNRSGHPDDDQVSPQHGVLAEIPPNKALCGRWIVSTIPTREEQQQPPQSYRPRRRNKRKKAASEADYPLQRLSIRHEKYTHLQDLSDEMEDEDLTISRFQSKWRQHYDIDEGMENQMIIGSLSLFTYTGQVNLKPTGPFRGNWIQSKLDLASETIFGTATQDPGLLHPMESGDADRKRKAAASNGNASAKNDDLLLPDGVTLLSGLPLNSRYQMWIAQDESAKTEQDDVVAPIVALDVIFSPKSKTAPASPSSSKSSQSWALTQGNLEKHEVDTSSKCSSKTGGNLMDRFLQDVTNPSSIEGKQTILPRNLDMNVSHIEPQDQQAPSIEKKMHTFESPTKEAGTSKKRKLKDGPSISIETPTMTTKRRAVTPDGSPKKSPVEVEEKMEQKASYQTAARTAAPSISQQPPLKSSKKRRIVLEDPTVTPDKPFGSTNTKKRKQKRDKKPSTIPGQSQHSTKAKSPKSKEEVRMLQTRDDTIDDGRMSCNSDDIQAELDALAFLCSSLCTRQNVKVEPKSARVDPPPSLQQKSPEFPQIHCASSFEIQSQLQSEDEHRNTPAPVDAMAVEDPIESARVDPPPPLEQKSPETPQDPQIRRASSFEIEAQLQMQGKHRKALVDTMATMGPFQQAHSNTNATDSHCPVESVAQVCPPLPLEQKMPNHKIFRATPFESQDKQSERQDCDVVAPIMIVPAEGLNIQQEMHHMVNNDSERHYDGQFTDENDSAYAFHEIEGPHSDEEDCDDSFCSLYDENEGGLELSSSEKSPEPSQSRWSTPDGCRPRALVSSLSWIFLIILLVSSFSRYPVFTANQHEISTAQSEDQISGAKFHKSLSETDLNNSKLEQLPNFVIDRPTRNTTRG